MANRFWPLEHQNISRNPKNFACLNRRCWHQNGGRQAAGFAAVICHLAFMLIAIVDGAKIGKGAVWQLKSNTLRRRSSKCKNRLVGKTNRQ